MLRGRGGSLSHCYGPGPLLHVYTNLVLAKVSCYTLTRCDVPDRRYGNSRRSNSWRRSRVTRKVVASVFKFRTFIDMQNCVMEGKHIHQRGGDSGRNKEAGFYRPPFVFKLRYVGSSSLHEVHPYVHLRHSVWDLGLVLAVLTSAIIQGHAIPCQLRPWHRQTIIVTVT